MRSHTFPTRQAAEICEKNGMRRAAVDAQLNLPSPSSCGRCTAPSPYGSAFPIWQVDAQLNLHVAAMRYQARHTMAARTSITCRHLPCVRTPP